MGRGRAGKQERAEQWLDLGDRSDMQLPSFSNPFSVTTITAEAPPFKPRGKACRGKLKALYVTQAASLS